LEAFGAFYTPFWAAYGKTPDKTLEKKTFFFVNQEFGCHQ
jgi:hypothetical protein